MAATLTGRVESFDGTSIYYEVHGELSFAKTPLVFCYGLVCAMTHFRHQVNVFSKDRACVFVDYRGHHRSARPSEKDITVKNCMEDVVTVVKHLQLREIFLVGHSLGGNVALLFAHHHPQLVKGVVSICSSARNPFETMFHTSLMQHVFEFVKEQHQKTPKLMEQLWALSLQKNAVNKAIVATLGFNRRLAASHDVDVYLQGVREVPWNVLAALLEDMAAHPMDPILPQIQTPTLIVSGERDLLQPPLNQLLLFEALPNSQWLSIPYGSHNAHVDMSEFVNLRMEKFFTELEEGKDPRARRDS